MIQSELEDIVNSVLTHSDSVETQNVVKIILNDESSSIKLNQAVSTVSDSGMISSEVKSIGGLGGNKVISGWINKDLQLSTSVNSENPAQVGLLKAAGSFINKAETAKLIAPRFGSDNRAGTAVAGLIEGLNLPPAGTQFGGHHFTRELWSGTSKPEFSVDLILINTTPEDNITTDYMSLLSICYPTTVSGESSLGPDTLMLPPSFLADGSSRISVKIGTWFYATNLIITKVAAVMSKQTISDGAPLYATVSIGFKSYYMLSANQYKEWFLLGNKNKSLTILKSLKK
jgi:hypothetical protein